MVGQNTPPPVVISSQVTLSTSHTQITKVVVDTKGDVIFVDRYSGDVFALFANGDPQATLGNIGGGWSNGGIAIDAQNNLYFTHNWSGNCIKVPYSNGSWNFGAQVGIAPSGSLGWYPGNDLAVDPAGNVYVAMGNGSGIWKYDASGAQTLLVKNLAHDPANIAVDASGNVYFVDQASPYAYRIPAGTTGLTDGTASLSTVGTGLSNARGVSVDANGNVFITDDTAKLVVEVPNENGMPNAAHQTVLTSFTGKGPSAINAQGNLFVTDGNNLVKVILGSADLGSNGVGASATSSSVFLAFNAPVTLGAASFTAGGASVTDFKDAGTGNCAAASYTAGQTCKLDVAFTPSVVGAVTGKLSVLDSGSIELSAAYLHGVGLGAQLAVGPGAQSNFASGFQAPDQTAIDRLGNVFVADSATGQVLKFAPGSSTGVAVGTGLSAPTGVAVDSFGNVFIADNGSVLKVSADGTQSTIATGLDNGKNIALDGAGNVLVADQNNGRVLKIVSSNVPVLPTNTAITVGSGFSQPTGVAVDASGNIFVADKITNTLWRISAAGEQKAITNVLSSPVALAVDASSSVYVAQANGVVRIPSENGAFNVNNMVAAASGIKAATGVSVDAAGNVYVSDAGAPGVIKVSPNATLALGKANLGEISSTLNATLFNLGNQSLIFNSPIYSASGPDAVDFQIANATSDACDPAVNLTPGTGCALLSATFAPLVTETSRVNQAGGDRIDALQILSNAVNSGDGKLTLTGHATLLNPTTTALTASPTGTLAYGDVITLSATVTPTTVQGTPLGTVTFIVDGVAQEPLALTNGSVQTTLVKANAGTHVIGATYDGDEVVSLFASSNAQITVVIQRAVSTTAVTPLAPYIQTGSNVSMSAVVTSTAGTPTGTVTFNDGSTVLGSTQLDAQGHASFTATGLADGVHTIIAKYMGDVNYLSSQSASTSTTLMPPSMIITASPASITVNAGSTATTTLTLTSIAGFNDQAMLSCVQATLPQNAVCAFNFYTTPQNVDTGKPQSVVLTIMTNVSTTTTQAKSSGGSLWMASTFALGLIGFVFGNRKKINARVASSSCMLLLFVAMAGFSSCGGEPVTKAPAKAVTPAGTTMVTVQAHGKSAANVNNVSLPFQIAVTVK